MPRPAGVTALSIFFALGTIPSTASGLALAFPGALSDTLWRIKPDAPAQFARLGPLAIPLMIGVAFACAGAAVGLWTRQRWGHRLAVGVLGVNLLGDTLNALVLGDWRTLIGLPIGGVMLVYLLSYRIREWFESRREPVTVNNREGISERLETSSPLIERALRPFQDFARRESSSGLLLLTCTVVALIWANSPWSDAYVHLWEIPITVGVGRYGIRESLHHWINDGLMVVFFFLVGLEIKREMLVGELASLRRATLPLAAALGGMLVPALFYVSVNGTGPGARGWGIPMATDIAFALGVLAILGPRIPLALKVFLTALAIVDDIGAVLVIALFYTAELSVSSLVWAGGLFAVLLACNGIGVRHPALYSLLGIGLWLAFLQSGVHATVAGVLLAFTIPARTRIDANEFLVRSRRAINRFAAAGVAGTDVLTSKAHQEALLALEGTAEAAQAPLQKLEDKLHGPVAFGIMPLFALANAGVALSGGAQAMGNPVALGVILGLVLGKPLGITLFAWLATKVGVAERLTDTSWGMLHGASWLGGIGFTMSLFIAGLAFEREALLIEAKLGILAGSLVAGTVGWLLLRRAAPLIRREM